MSSLAVERLLADLMASADIRDRRVAGVRLTQDPNLLLRRVSLTWHDLILSSGPD